MGNSSLGHQPTIDPTASVIKSQLGVFTEIGPRCDITETSFGDYSYVAGDAEIIYTTIGKFVSIASHTRINPGNHPMWSASQHHFIYRASKYGMGTDQEDFFQWRRDHHVSIGHDTWIGHGAVIMPGRSIGIGAIIGAGAIITKDVPDYAICVGNPGHILRYRFEKPIQDALKRIQWWDWPHDKISENLADFRRLSIDDFCKKHDV